MATSTINNITLDYPDSPCMVFNPCPLKVTGTLAKLQVYINTGLQSYSLTYETPNGGVIDVQEFMQSFFDGLYLGDDIDYTQACKASELGKDVNITVIALDTDSSTLAQFNITIFCVWAALTPGEDYIVHRNIKRFCNYPLTVGVHAANAAGGSINVIDADDNNNVDTNTVAADGLFNVLVDLIPTGNTIDVEYSFSRMGVPVTEKIYTVECVDACCKDVIYLRWIDRRGFWCYWLFKKGSDTRSAVGEGMFRRNDLYLYDRTWQWHGNSGRRQNYSRQDVIPVCAPLVDRDTFDFLQDVTTSPAVDMYLGKVGTSHKWMPVIIEAGSYTKEMRRPEQDFIMNIVLPEIQIQKL